MTKGSRSNNITWTTAYFQWQSSQHIATEAIRSKNSVVLVHISRMELRKETYKPWRNGLVRICSTLQKIGLNKQISNSGHKPLIILHGYSTGYQMLTLGSRRTKFSLRYGTQGMSLPALTYLAVQYTFLIQHYRVERNSLSGIRELD